MYWILACAAQAFGWGVKEVIQVACHDQAGAANGHLGRAGRCFPAAQSLLLVVQDHNTDMPEMQVGPSTTKCIPSSAQRLRWQAMSVPPPPPFNECQSLWSTSLHRCPLLSCSCKLTARHFVAFLPSCSGG